MEDRRRPSSSDELLDRARGHTETPSRFDEFVPNSPADAYYEAFLAGDDPQPEDSDGERLDATAIAAELLEAGQIESADRKEPEPSWPPSTGDASLASRAMAEPDTMRADDPPPEPVSPPPSAVSDRSGIAPGFDGVIAGEGDRWSTPTTEWERIEAERIARRQSRFDIPVARARTLVILAAFGFFALGILLPMLSGLEPIADATVGDCFVVGDAVEVDDIEVVACSEPHDSELFLRVDMVPAFGTSLPDDDRAFDWLFEQCLGAFPAYTGESYQESRYWIDMFIPTAEAWQGGDHTGMCTLVVFDENLNLTSTSGSGRAGGSSA